MTILLAALTGSCGAACRYWVSGAVQRRSGGAFPVGTAVVNLVGAFILGLVVGAWDASAAWTVASVGFLGGFTTFSTWMVETVRLGVVPRVSLLAAVNAIGVPALGLALAATGYHLTM